MPNLVLHKTTERQLHEFVARPSHAVLIVGAEGIGKGSVSRKLAAELLGKDIETLEGHPYLKFVSPEKQSISIESIRDLQQFAKLKIPATSGGVQRIAIIESADLLTTEAQNALLKLLEEPPTDTVLMLTAANSQALLPTIRSRAQAIVVQQPDLSGLESHFTTLGFDNMKIRQAYMMSGGLPGLMFALLSESEEHPLAKVAQQARDILRATTFERLAMVDIIAKQRPEALRLLFVLQQMAQAALEQASSKADAAATQSVKRWQHVLSKTYEAESAMLGQAQPKLVLTNLLLNI